jgi:hypothetical protein
MIDPRHAVFADGAIVRAIDIESGNEAWSFEPKGSASFGGSAMQILHDGSWLLLAIEHSYGWELQRLLASDGKANGDPIFIGRDAIDLSRSAVAHEVYALHLPDRVIAVNPNGKLLWDHPISWGVPWRVQATRSVLQCHPDAAIPALDPDMELRLTEHDLTGIPDAEGIRQTASLLYHGYLRRSFPVLVIDPRDGKKTEEMTIPTRGPRAALLLGDRPAIVVEGEWFRLRPK